VVQQGVYMHGVYGPCKTELEAKELAQALAIQDNDDYHTWDVCRLAWDDFDDTPIASYRKWSRSGWSRWDVTLARDAREECERQAMHEHTTRFPTPYYLLNR
jgi:hypothetical protein